MTNRLGPTGISIYSGLACHTRSLYHLNKEASTAQDGNTEHCLMESWKVAESDGWKVADTFFEGWKIADTFFKGCKVAEKTYTDYIVSLYLV